MLCDCKFANSNPKCRFVTYWSLIYILVVRIYNYILFVFVNLHFRIYYYKLLFRTHVGIFSMSQFDQFKFLEVFHSIRNF